MNKLKTLKSILGSVELRTRALPWMLGVLSFISIGSFGIVLANYSEAVVTPKVISLVSFDDIRISARSVLVWDALTKQTIFEKNADSERPLASLTKLMAALTVEEQAATMHDVTVTDADINTEGDSGLHANSKWDTHSLIDYSLLVSSNDGISALAGAAGAFMGNTDREKGKEIFISNMNALALKVGMKDSKFMNEHGLDQDENHVGAYGSARDVAILFDYILENHPDILESTKYGVQTLRDEDGGVYNAFNTNVAVDLIPSILASKTGFTDLAGGNLVVAFDAGLNHPVIISILGSTKDGRFEDVVNLASSTIKYIQDNQ